MNTELIFKNIGKIVVAVLSAGALLLVTLFIVILLSFNNVHADFYSYILLVIAVLIEIGIVGALWGIMKKKLFYIPLCVVLGICIVVSCVFSCYQSYVDNIPTIGESDNLLVPYAPYTENSKTVMLDEECELILTEKFPVMDGATALYPIYSAFAKAVYPREILNGSKFLKCTTTTEAYYNIVTGDADIIFVAAPSEEQRQFAAENGVELVYTPIGKEAFVFFVNAKNPIENITVEDIRKIYSGEIRQWSEFGVQKLGEIMAFQRDKGSGSQSTLEKIMGENELMIPPKENVIGGMGGIIEKTADYKNYKNAIGYSFRFYSTEMVSNRQIKLLNVNGIYPNLENIENGTYPIASYFYAVTRSDADENTLKLLDWIQGKQGQEIIEMTGYTPLQK